MPKIRALTPQQARSTLVARFGPRADRLRQFNTNFGARSKRVFLVWESWGGGERGVGTPRILARVELLPTPKVSDLSAVQRRSWLEGALSDGSGRVDEISVHRYTEDMLRGLTIPGEPGTAGTPVNAHGAERDTSPRIDFFYEIVEDGRGDNPAARQRFQINGYPFRKETSVQFGVYLVRESEDLTRRGQPEVLGSPATPMLTAADIEDK